MRPSCRGTIEAQTIPGKLTNDAYLLSYFTVEAFYRHEKKHEWRKQLAVLLLHLHLSKHELLPPVRMPARSLLRHQAKAHCDQLIATLALSTHPL